MSALERVVVVDSDGVNPYGSELAELLAPLAPRVELVTPADNAFLPRSVGRAWLRPTRSKATRRDAAREVATILRLCLSVVRGSAVPVLVWARTYQKLLLLAASSLRGTVPLVYVSHNPGAGRDHPGRIRRLVERLLLRRAHVVTHARSLEQAARGAGARSTFVVPHLPYRAYCERFRIGGRRADTRDEHPVGLLLLGALRPDKFTAADVRRLRDELATSGGRFRLIAAVRPRVELDGVDGRVPVVDMSRDDALDDEAIAAAFAEADVLVAPYRNPTDSGTVMLSLTAGVPVVAFDGGALRTHLPDESLVRMEDWAALRERCERASELAVPDEWVDEAAAAATDGWRSVLTSAGVAR